MTNTVKRNGFTLIEMAIVLVIVGLLVGLTLPVINDFIKRDKLSSGQDVVYQLKDAIMGYAIANSCLPKPSMFDPADSDYLGLSLQDAWGNDIIYITPTELDDGQDLCNENIDDTGLSIQKKDSADNDDGSPIQNVAYALISKGPNHTVDVNLTAESGPVTSDDPTTVTTSGPYTEIETYPKGLASASVKPDDIVEYVTLDVLKGRVCTEGSTGGPVGSQISFADNIGDFGAASQITAPSYVTIDTTSNTISLGEGSGGSSPTGYGCTWYQGDTDGHCTDGACKIYDTSVTPNVTGLRVYFTYDVDIGTSGSGWTFAVVTTNPYYSTNDVNMCGGNMLGYAQVGSGGRGVNGPKFGIEMDYYDSGDPYEDPDVNPGNSYDPHLALVFFGTYNSVNNDAAHGYPASPNTTYGELTSPAIGDSPTYPDDFGKTYADATGSYFSRTDDYGGKDAATHSWRMDLVITDNGDTTYTYDWRVYIDCANSSDLTSDYTWTSGGKTFRYRVTNVPATFHDRLKTSYLGWTFGNGVSTLKVTISDFGLRFRQ